MDYRNIRCLKIVTVLGIIFSISCISQNQVSYTQAMSKGIDEYTNGDYVKAEKSFTEALKIAENEGNADLIVTVLGYLGRTLDERGKNDDAESALKRRMSIAKTENLNTQSRLETFLALAIFYTKHQRCDEGQRVLHSIESENAELEGSGEYVETITLISDLLKLHCKSHVYG